MNDLVIKSNLQISPLFAKQSVNDDLTAGIVSSLGVLSFGGKVWKVRYQKEDHPLMRDGDPVASIEVVIIKAQGHNTKTFYKEGYQGGNLSPDCFSNDGVTPDAAAPSKQAQTCSVCPHNAFGSGTNGKGKACSDYKRLAVVPAADLDNEAFGGPMLLRVPAGSLKVLTQYGQQLKSLDVPYCAVVTKIGFDPKEQYPKLTLTAVRGLSNEEAEKILELRDSDAVARVFGSASNDTDDGGSIASAPKQRTNYAKAEEPPKPAPTPAVVFEADDEATAPASVEADLDAQLNSLLGE